jgi:hypothetical protein
MDIAFWATIITVLILAFFLLYIAKKSGNRKRLKASLSQTLFLVRIPVSAEQGLPAGQAGKLEEEIGKFEEFLSGLTASGGTPALEIAVPHVGEEIHFYVSLPRASAQGAIKQIQGIWSGASVETAPDDYTIFSPHGSASGAYLLQKENFALPFRTYTEIGQDSFSAILGGFSKIQEIGEGAALQIIISPAPKGAKRQLENYIKSLKRGESLKEIFGKESLFGAGALKGVVSPEKPEDKKEKTIDESALAALNLKTSKPFFRVNVRILASAPTPRQADSILDGILAGLDQFGSPERNEFKAVKPKAVQKLAHNFIFREFEEKQSMILNAAEISGIYHFPISSTQTPKVKWLKSKEAPPPANLSKEGTLLGESAFQGDKKPVYITDEDRGRHIYIVGQTGTGKSTLLGNMIIKDLERGKGLALLDPHGDLAEAALSHIPANRADDLVYFDPGDISRPLGLNMLEVNPSRPEEKTFIVNEMQSIFNKLFTQETMGPMFEQYMRNALLLLMEDMDNEPATLTEVPRVFTDPEYRKRKLARIGNPVVIDFWEKEAVKAGGEASLANMTPYITSKFNNFISNDYMRPIIGQVKSALNFREAMDSGKIILINLAKGRIGDINANLLGMIITGKILMAALSRTDIPEPKRRDFNLYIDEFHNFTTDSISTIFSEARKYKLSLTVAHQFIDQLTDQVRDSVFGNVGSQISFRVGPQDAEFLVKQFGPTFDANDLQNIDNLNVYAKILIRGETSKPFNMKIGTESWQKGSPEIAEQMKSHAREKFGKDRKEVEADILKRLRE